MRSLAAANLARNARAAQNNELATGRVSIEDVLIFLSTASTRDSLR
jgi:hypothetical protein